MVYSCDLTEHLLLLAAPQQQCLYVTVVFASWWHILLLCLLILLWTQQLWQICQAGYSSAPAGRSVCANHLTFVSQISTTAKLSSSLIYFNISSKYKIRHCSMTTFHCTEVDIANKKLISHQETC
jgi:hypothetical protein